MDKTLLISPYISLGIGVFLNFFWIFQREQLSMGVQVVFLALTVFLILLSSILGAMSQKGQKKKLFLQGGQWVLFIYYLYILSMLLFFGGLFQIHRSYHGEFQLIPFQTIDSYIAHYRRTGSFVSFYNLLGNLLIMVPFGYFIPSLFPKMRHFGLFMPFLALCTISVEVVQWLTDSGIGDIDDSILNFMGGMIAYFFTRCHQLLQKALKT